jgi:energy-converting hydrogenase Eha subunit B
LLAVLGYLEAVWADDGLAAVLLDLPLSVMLLLLKMDGLQVTNFVAGQRIMCLRLGDTAALVAGVGPSLSATEAIGCCQYKSC